MSTTRELSLILSLKDKASKQMQGFRGELERMKPAFQKMAGYGTAAFAGVAAGVFKATQSASDAQETFNKFDTVFGDISEQSEKVAQDLRNNFGLAESSAKDLLSSTGDMLTGFGLSGKAALDLAEKTNKLAVDLASFTNIEGGAERASKALTKALLGERESVKELGIAILEEDVKAKVESMRATGELTTETDRQARALATLEIAISQSKNAIGDYARTQNSLANQQRLLKERTKELKETFGQLFIPILQSVVEKILPIIKNISDWAKENPKLAKTITLVALGLSGLVAVVGALGLAMIAFNPIALGISLAIGAIAAAVIFLVQNWERFMEFLQSIGVYQFFKETWDSIVSTFRDKLLPALRQLWEQLSFLKPVLLLIAKIVGAVVLVAVMALVKGVQLMVSIWSAVFNIISKVVNFFKDIFVKTFEKAKDIILSIVDAINKLIDAISRLAKKLKGSGGGLLGKALSGIKGLFGGGKSDINDGIVQGGKVITTHPDDFIMAMKDPSKLGGGGGVSMNITITGNTFMGEDDIADRVGEQIMRTLKQNVKLT